MPQLRPCLLAVAIAAIPAAASAQSGGPPEARLYIDVATHDMPGMPELGRVGQAAAGLFGGGRGGVPYGMTRFPAMPGQYLDIALHSTARPGAPAEHAIPAALKLGERLPLRAPVATVPAPGTAAGPAQGIGDGGSSSTRILVYWGCGNEVRAGQPREIRIDARDGKVEVSGTMAGRVVPDRGIQPGPDYALWPNPDHGKRVPDGASVAGAHQVTGDGVPESLRFELQRAHDFMPKIALDGSGGLAEGMNWRWRPVERALGYFLYAVGTRGDTTVMWSSSELPDAGMELATYLPDEQVARWVREKVLLSPATTACAMPRGIFAGADGAGAGMLGMVAYGPEHHLAWPERPASAPAGWAPEWDVRLRSKSTAMVTLGLPVAAAGAAGTADPASPQEEGRNALEKAGRGLLRGILGR